MRILPTYSSANFLQDAGDVDLGESGIADALLAHHVGDARGFGFEMETLDAQRRELRQIEMRQDVEHHQHGDAGSVRRALPDVETFIHGADRHRRLGGVAGEVFQRVQAAGGPQGLDHVLGDRALVEGIGAALGDRPQRLAKLRLLDHVAGDGRLAVRQQIALGVDALLQLLEAVLPVEGDAGRDDIAFFGRLDRRLEQSIEAEFAVVAQDRRPAIDRAGNGDRVRRGQRDRIHIALEIPFRRRRLRCAARAVIGNDLALALRLDQREAIAANAGRLRFDHREQRGSRDRRIRSRPSGFSTSMAASAACGWDVATMAFWEWTVDRPARWKFLMRNGSLCR